MNGYNEALRNDMEGNFREAIAQYEQALAIDSAPLDAYLNLAFLYWQCIDFGFLAYHSLDDIFVDSAAIRYKVILQEAEYRYPDSIEVRFWKLYFDYITLGINDIIMECHNLAHQDNLVPYFFLFAHSGGNQYGEQAKQLIERCKKVPTAKNRYIQSVLESNVFSNSSIRSKS